MLYFKLIRLVVVGLALFIGLWPLHTIVLAQQADVQALPMGGNITNASSDRDDPKLSMLFTGHMGLPKDVSRDALFIGDGPLSRYPTWISSDSDSTYDISWGDVDGDGDLDLAVGNNGPNKLYLNEGGVLQAVATWTSAESDETYSLAWGDVDGDGDLDLIVGNNGPNKLYLNENGVLNPVAVWASTDSDDTRSVAWGDIDGDGDLDLITGNYGGANKVYLNEGGSLQPVPAWTSGDSDDTQSVALGDVDGDGDLDLVVGNSGSPNKLYLNQGGSLQSVSAWTSADSDETYSVAWGDVDGDGDLDLVVGNWGANKLYLNELGTLQEVASWVSDDSDDTQSVALWDIDGDGDLDLAVGNWEGPNKLYLNAGGTLQAMAIWASADGDYTYSVAWGDVDGDGDLDLVAGNWNGSNKSYMNEGGPLQAVAAWSPVPIDETRRLAWGDVDGDGDLDLAVGNWGPNRLYLNENGVLQTVSIWFPNDSDLTDSVAWGDVDGDGDLDLVVGNWSGPNKLYLNESGMLQTGAIWVSADSDMTTSVAWGDVDGDGDLDLAVGNANGPNKLYLNEGGLLQSTAAWVSADSDDTYSLAWGDVDGDGDLDLVAGNRNSPNKLYLNEGGVLQPIAAWLSSESDNSYDVAWGDIDGDGDLDLAVANFGGPNRLYLNEGGSLQQIAVWNSADSELTTSLAWGDMDGDGDLDLAAGNRNGQNRLYVNVGDMLHPVAFGVSTDTDMTTSVAWGDMDGDGDLDLVVGNSNGPNKLHLNIRQEFPAGLLHNTLLIALEQPSGLPGSDFFAISGNLSGPTIPFSYTLFKREGDSVGQVWAEYSLDGGGHWQPALPAAGTITNNLDSSALAGIVGYWPFDSGTLTNTLDASGHGMSAMLYGPNWTTNTTPVLGNNPHALFFDGQDDYAEVAHDPRLNPGRELTLAVWVRLDDVSDGKIIGKGLGAGYVLGHANGQLYPEIWDSNGTHYSFYAGNIPNGIWTHLAVTWQSGGSMRGYINGVQVQQIPASSQPIGASSYPLRLGASSWDVNAHLVEGSIDDARVYHRALSGEEIASLASGRCVRGCRHTFVWDAFASGFFGQSSNVVLRLIASPQITTEAIAGTHRYPNRIPGPFLRGSASATTFPFPVRGTQVRVYSETVTSGNELPNAIVYRLPDAQSSGAQVMSNSGGQPYVTAQNGFLQGRGELNAGDQLVALLPITNTQNYILYQTSATPTPQGLAMHTVTEPGVQALAVSSANHLLLFKIIVSLEWDARQDSTFLEQLQRDIRRASEILYDVTNGQAALGEVHIYHDRGYWGQAHVVIPAANTVRPSAILGGSVLTPTHDIVSPTLTITNAYIPGQVRMPPTWNRFGEPSGTLGEDWPRTLAHELVHYLFFHPDNYLGLSEAGMLRIIDCPGSIMSDPYLYDELLTRAEWDNNPVCQQTLSQQYLGRSDWETVQQFYAVLNTTETNTGPTVLPLAAPEITVFDPPTATFTLAAPFFRLQDVSGEPSPIPNGQAQAYLIKQRSTLSETHPYVIAQGTPIGDMLHARGAAPGDRLCVFDYSQRPPRVGCQTASHLAEPLTLHELPGWTPQIQVTPISTDTVNIVVTNISDNALMGQILPASGRSSEIVPFIQQGSVFSQTITAPDGAYYGYVHVWNPDSPSPRELIVEFVGIDDWGGRSYAWGVDPYDWQSPAYGWGGRSYAWGGRSYAWGGRSYAWGAPVMSSDGQVSVFPLDNLFGENEGLSLQQLFLPPDLPAWLTPVGQGYRFTAGETIGNAAIIFRYLPRDVPSGYESVLRVYYSPDEGQTWQRLNTELDTYRNHASAMMPGQGIYVLVATVEVSPAFAEGWNMFGYPVQQPQPITSALASIDGRYTAVANYDPNRPEPWHTYYVTVTAPFRSVVNTLTELAFTQAYWLYATEPITLYLSPGLPGVQLHAPENIQFPPATYYGWITPTAGFTPTAGMTVTGWINGSACGQTGIEELDGKLAYSLKIVAENAFGTPNGCGAPGRVVQFQVGEWVMGHNNVWDNSQAWFHSLSSVAPDSYSLYLPLVVKGGGAVSHQPGNVSGFSAVLPVLLFPMILIGVMPILVGRRRTP